MNVISSTKFGRQIDNINNVQCKRGENMILCMSLLKILATLYLLSSSLFFSLSSFLNQKLFLEGISDKRFQNCPLSLL